MFHPRLRLLLTVTLALAFTGRSDGALVANWKADTYTSGNWIDSVFGIQAAPVNGPVVVQNAFGTRKGINFAGNSYFLVPAVGNHSISIRMRSLRGNTRPAAGWTWLPVDGPR